MPLKIFRSTQADTLERDYDKWEQAEKPVIVQHSLSSVGAEIIVSVEYTRIKPGERQPYKNEVTQ